MRLQFLAEIETKTHSQRLFFAVIMEIWYGIAVEKKEIYFYRMTNALYAESQCKKPKKKNVLFGKGLFDCTL